jgi:hypothetical protein
VRWPGVLALVLTVLGALAPNCSAQAKRSKGGAPPVELKPAAVRGTVRDASGSALAGATVTVENAGGFAQSAISDSQGGYELTDLPPGSYTLTVMVGDAKVFSEANLELTPAQEVKKPIVIEAAAAHPAATPAAATQPASGQSPATSEPSLLLRPPVVMPTLAASAADAGASSISGTVNDQTGAVVVNATVKVNDAGGVVQTAVTDANGSYSIKGLPAGSYNVTVTAAGFKKFEADNIVLAPGQPLPLDAGLEPGGEKTEVNVEGQKVATVETENAQVSGTVTEKEVLTLGLNGRNFTQLIALTPGVSNQTQQDEAKVGVTGSVKYSVNGGRVEYNTFEVDGSDVLNAGLNGAESTLVVYPSLDAIQEVKVLASNYGAMYGRTASGTVMVTTKSGTGQWHGSGYEFIRNEAFNARNYFDQTKSAPLYRRNDFGFTLGGPLFIPHFYNAKKDKTFVFWSEEFRFEKSPTDLQPDFNRGVPSLAERQGDFSDVCPAAPVGTQVFFSRVQFPDCPSSGTGNSGGQLTFPGNNISNTTQGNAFSVLDPNALALLSTNLIPLPNSSTGCNSTTGSCYNAVISEPTHWREELFRVDQQIGPKDRLSFRYIHDSWDTVTPIPEWGFVQNSFPSVQNKFVGPGISMVVHLTDTISPSLLNEFTASYTNSHITLNNINGPGGASSARPAGLDAPCTTLPNGNLPVTSCPMGSIFSNGFGGKAPGIVIGGTNLEYGGNGFAVDTSYMPWEHTNPTFSYRDDISKVIRGHTLQFGVQLIFAQKNEDNGAIGAASGDLQGILTFSNVNGGVLNTGNSFANFLALSTRQNGNAIQSYTQDSRQYRYYNRYRIGEPYIQDDWKVNSRLTLNLGLRFSLFGLYHEKYLRGYNWDPSAYSPALAAQLRVDPVTGQLVNAGAQATPIPINLSSPDPRITNGIIQCGVNNVPQGCMNGHVFNPAPRVGIAWDPRGDGKTSIRAGYGIFFEHGTGEEANTGSLEASAPLVLSMTQRFPQNYGCIGGLAGTAGGCAAQPGAYPLNVTAIPSTAVWSYAQQWSLSVQRELPKSMVGTIAYVGSKGTHLTVERQLNQLKPLPSALNPFGINEPLIPQSPITSGGDCGGYSPASPGSTTSFQLLNGTTVGPQDPAFFNLLAACAGANPVPKPATPDVNTLRPYPGLGQIFSLQNGADSSYHAFQTTVRRTKGPLTIGVSYSFSHSIDDSSDRSDATFVNSYDLRSNKGSSNFDQRHLLSVSYIYDLPMLHLGQKIREWAHAYDSDKQETSETAPLPDSGSGIGKKLLDGWQISGIAVFQSGTPFSVINGGSGAISVLDNAGVANGIGAGSYPDVIDSRDAVRPVGGNNSKSFGPLLGNPNIFVAPRGLTFGNAGRNVLNNPHRTNFDLSILKHYAITESSVLEFRAEAFNIFNHTQFRIYNPDVGNTGSNVISCYGGPNNTAGFTAPGGVDCLTGNSFLHPVDAHRPRTIQFGLKFSF